MHSSTPGAALAPTATIRASDLPLVLAAAKARRRNHGRTPQLAALSGCPVIEVDCRSSSHWTRPGLIRAAHKHGTSPARVTPMQRGHIALVYERVAALGGRREVLRTWGSGIRALRAEPRYVLNGGEAVR